MSTELDALIARVQYDLTGPDRRMIECDEERLREVLALVAGPPVEVRDAAREAMRLERDRATRIWNGVRFDEVNAQLAHCGMTLAHYIASLPAVAAPTVPAQYGSPSPPGCEAPPSRAPPGEER